MKALTGRSFVYLVVCAISLVMPSALPAQTTLTGAMWFAANPTGGTNISQAYADGASNTLGGDQWWNLWLALKPDASMPVNGPSDIESNISIPLQPGRSYKYYLFAQGPCCTLRYSGINLFFDGDSNTPGISVFGVLDNPRFAPNANSSTFTLQAGTVAGAGRAFYTAGGMMVVLTGYQWNDSGTLDVCQAFTFAPGTEPSSRGTLALQAFAAASLTSSLTGAVPGNQTTLTGSGFAPQERVRMYFGGLHSIPVAAATADSNGVFAAAVTIPPAVYGPQDVYALGKGSGKLGAASLFIAPGLAINPRAGAPGGKAAAQGAGFGASESVQVYWGSPRQLLGTAVTDSSGSFTGTGALLFTIPANAPHGTNAIVATGSTTGAVGLGKITVE